MLFSNSFAADRKVRPEMLSAGQQNQKKEEKSDVLLCFKASSKAKFFGLVLTSTYFKIFGI